MSSNKPEIPSPGQIKWDISYRDSSILGYKVVENEVVASTEEKQVDEETTNEAEQSNIKDNNYSLEDTVKNLNTVAKTVGLSNVKVQVGPDVKALKYSYEERQDILNRAKKKLVETCLHCIYFAENSCRKNPIDGNDSVIKDLNYYPEYKRFLNSLDYTVITGENMRCSDRLRFKKTKPSKHFY